MVAAASSAGSSPLARGLRSSCRRLLLACRIIPARAGFTWGRRWWRGASRDHPRSRGVYLRSMVQGLTGIGSSPLARGLRAEAGTQLKVMRIIPARAGFTLGRPNRIVRGADHPPSRGVYDGLIWIQAVPRGSSPLARGLRRVEALLHLGHRIIPARAGFTAASTCRPSRPTDHPRSRGVYPHGRLDPLDPPGSSPLARGLRGQGDRRHPGPGIIPARAGFTGDDGASPAGGGDHPRSRGVYPRVPVTTTSVPGSSPLARGLRTGSSLTSLRTGIIPARAGFTTTRRGTPTTWRDHPRSRGVYRR